MMERSFWEQSGHWENYGENMFTTTLPDERVFCCKPMNCPGHVQIFKHGLKSYRDLPLEDRRVRQGAPLRALGRAARHAARAPLHPGRRASLHLRGHARAGMPRDQRSDAVDLRGLRLHARSRSSCRPGPKSASARMPSGISAEAVMGKVLEQDQGVERRRAASRRRSTPARAPSTARSSSIVCATPSAATGSAARRRSTSTCRAGSAPSTSTSTPTRSCP